MSVDPPSSAVESAIEIRNLRFRYPETSFALTIDHWQVNAGQQIACIGPSGSGKTTLLQLLAGTLRATSGEVQVLGLNLTALSEKQRRETRLRRIGMVWQEFALLDHLSVLENTLLPVRLDSGQGTLGAFREAARETLGQLGLEHRLNQSPARLSQGERQRVAIARALVRSPQLILADEPTGNLDPANKQKILEILLEHAAKNQATVVFVTHDHSLLHHFRETVAIDDLNRDLADSAVDSQSGGA